MGFDEKFKNHSLKATAVLSGLEDFSQGLTSLEVANASMRFQMVAKDRLEKTGIFLVTSQQLCQVFENEADHKNEGFNALKVEAVFVPETINYPSQDYINSWKREFEGKIKFLLAQMGFLKAEIFYTDGQFAKITTKEIDDPNALS